MNEVKELRIYWHGQVKTNFLKGVGGVIGSTDLKHTWSKKQLSSHHLFPFILWESTARNLSPYCLTRGMLRCVKISLIGPFLIPLWLTETNSFILYINISIYVIINYIKLWNSFTLYFFSKDKCIACSGYYTWTKDWIMELMSHLHHSIIIS